MAKTLVMYYSKYGFTKKYAEWLAEELEADIYSIGRIRKKMLDKYEIIILGSSIYAGSISGTKILIKNFEKIKQKKLVVFTCGIADVTNVDSMTEINNKIMTAIPENIRPAIKLFNLQGGIIFPILSFRHRMILSILNKALTHKATSDLTEDNIRFLNAYGKNRDYTDRENITEIVNYCRGVSNEGVAADGR